MHPTVSFFISPFQLFPTLLTVILVRMDSDRLFISSIPVIEWDRSLSFEDFLPCPYLFSFNMNLGFFLNVREFRCDPPEGGQHEGKEER